MIKQFLAALKENAKMAFNTGYKQGNELVLGKQEEKHE